MRERWFGATGRRVPAIALEGTVDVADALVVDSLEDLEELRVAHALGQPVVIRAGDADAVARAPRAARDLVRPRPGSGRCSSSISPSSRMADRRSRRTRSARATSPQGTGASPPSRSSSPSESVVPWAEPHVGAIATQSYANPRYGPDGLAPPGRGAYGRGGRRAADRGRRRARPPPARSRRRPGARGATFTGSGCHRLGGRPDGRRLRGTGEHPRLGGDRRRARRDLRGVRGRAARRATARVPRRGGGRRRRQPWPAVGRVARGRARRRLRAGFPTSLVDLRVDDHAEPIEELRRLYGIHDRLFGTTPRDHWLAVDDELRAELGERLAQARATSSLRSCVGGNREPGGTASTGRTDRPGRPGRAEEADMSERYASRARWTRSSGYSDRGQADVAADQLGARRGCLRDQRLDGDRGRAAADRRARRARSARATRSCTSSRRPRTFTVDGREIDAPAGHVGLRLRPARASGAAATGERGTTVLAVGAPARRGFEVSPWERSADALRFWPTDEWDRAIEVLEGELAERPDSAGDALQPRLRRGPRRAQRGCALPPPPCARARRASPRTRTDDDFESIRDDPRFPVAA